MDASDSTQTPDVSARGSLSAASVRLRRKPGRPRTRPDRPPRDPIAVAAVAALPPRLLSVASAALYLAVSEDAVREMLAAGHLPKVRLPGAARRVLLDRSSIDQFIDENRGG